MYRVDMRQSRSYTPRGAPMWRPIFDLSGLHDLPFSRGRRSADQSAARTRFRDVPLSVSDLD